MTSENNATPASASHPKQRITPRALLEAKRLSDPKIHPDGHRVAFVVTEADFDESRWVSHVWLTEWLPEEAGEGEPAPPKGEKRAEGASDEEAGEHDPTRQLTFSHEGEAHPRWSPDGAYLGFLSARPDPTAPSSDEDDEEEPKDQIWVLPVDGGEARRVTNAKEGVMDYTWTPDSRAIVYLAPEPRPRPIESVRKEDRERRKIDPVVEHDDRLRRQFWRVDVEERKPKLLFTGDYGIEEFALSPDGERLCYTTNYTGEWNDYHLLDLWLLDLKDGATFKLVERAGGKYHPRWSPDGKTVAFLSWFDPELSYSRESLFGAEAPASLSALPSGSPSVRIRPLSPEWLDYDLTEFLWSPHDRAIYARAAVGTGDEIYRLDGEAVALKLDGAAERQGLERDAESGALVYVQESATALPEIFLREEQGGVHQLTKLNAEFAETYLLPRQEVVTWTSPDGMTIEGVLTYPLDYEEGTRAPLIAQIHGGPKGRATNTLRDYYLAAVWSAEGYAVLQPNFRGSAGYGNAVAVANRRDLGGGDFADIMAGIDRCIAQGLADPARLGIMGGSYGGYMTNWAIGHTDRFKAAVSMFGIFHLQTDYSNSDLSRWDNDYLGAYYWEDPEIYRRLSPGSYIENIKTPTLIIHGDDDNNTFISNSKELYQALRHRGVTAQFVHYPREGHGLREPNHKLDEIRRSLAWMDRYVRHGGQNPGVYRIGDRVPSPDGLLELCVTRAEVVTFPGQPPAKSAESDAAEREMAFLEVALTLQHGDSRRAASPLTLSLADLRLEVREQATGTGEWAAGTEGRTLGQQATGNSSSPMPNSLHPTPYTLHPVGIPLDAPGGKALVEGDNLRIRRQPDEETGQLAFACAVVFRVVKAGGDGLLRVGDFPPVALAWAGDEKEREKEDAAD
jgi:dipeptidyl aminopeptidase/acylaminoacyl peptidase